MIKSNKEMGEGEIIKNVYLNFLIIGRPLAIIVK